MTNPISPSSRQQKQLENAQDAANRKEKKKQDERYGLTRSTKLFIGAIVVLLVLLVSGAITYLTIALNDSRSENRAQDIAISEWSRRYVSLYDQYSNVAGSKPTSLSPSAVQYLINTESGSSSASSPIPGVIVSGNSGGATAVPPSVTYSVKVDGKTVKITCEPAPKYDPSSPSFVCK